MFWTSTPASTAADVPSDDPPALHRQLSDKIDIEEPLCCPITRRLFFDPAILIGDGFTYERSAIETWLAGNDTSPMTGSAVECKTLVPNFTVRALADAARPADDDRAHVVPRRNACPKMRQSGERAGDERVPDENVARVAMLDGTSALRRVFLDDDDPPLSYTVTGAGRSDVNGTYVRVGDYNSRPCYENAENGDVWLVSYDLGTRSFWYLARKDNLHSDVDDYYRVPSESRVPPSDNWALARDGVEPAPTVIADVAERGALETIVRNTVLRPLRRMVIRPVVSTVAPAVAKAAGEMLPVVLAQLVGFAIVARFDKAPIRRRA